MGGTAGTSRGKPSLRTAGASQGSSSYTLGTQYATSAAALEPTSFEVPYRDKLQQYPRVLTLTLAAFPSY